ncbi:serine/threonine-protein kinase [Streptomyces sp. NPDC089915]|uniref:serine/threonine-protein kinase n=1 Tax=Streptomyces sp. NPDC089915 TaxID=3155186 RepID=UPI00341B5039
MDGLTSEDPVRVDRYRLLRRLGAGGMGTVYLASGPGGDLVALKAIHASRAREPEFRRRFDREALAVMRVADRWIPPFEAAGREGDVPWLATRYVPALSLAEAVEEYGALPADACWWMLNCLVSALSTVHGAGLVHRDLKPANVLLTDDGALLIDFGIAHTPTDTRLTATGHFIGSAGYGAPETVRGEEVSGQADVFALGGVLTYAASGRPPFGRGTYEAVVARSLTADPMTDGIGNAELRALARACLAKDPGRRAALGTVAASVRAATAGRGAGRWPWLPVALLARIRARADEAAAAAAPPTRPGQQATT